MRRWAFLVRPGWIALALVVAAFAYLCFTVLAPWQLGKNSRTSRENDQIAASLNADAVPVTSLLAQGDSAQWRRVTASGRYVGATVLARLREVDGQPAFEVLTPFVVDGGPMILVDRGYVRPPEGSAVPALPSPPSAPVTITARLRDSENRSDKAPITGSATAQVYSINTEQVGELTGSRLADPYLQLVENQPGGLGVLPLPHLDAGPFLSYGIQWIAFGILAPIGLGYFAYAEIKHRRHDAAQKRTAPVTAEEKLADRYGRRR
ncbi:MAG: SURF1 family protein [Mycobacteriaceae bacterium]|nr:SURF1 family protein [Mycobacteriaceae bacterium]